MLKRVVHSLGLVENTDKDPGRKNQAGGAKSSPDFSFQSKERFVRIVHAGGKVEQYPHTIPAARLMDKYPGMCIALPEVFKSPHNSVLWPDEFLIPGQKYIIISPKSVEKLKRKYPEDRTTEPNGVGNQILEAEITKSPGQHKVKENGNFKVHNDTNQEILEAKSDVSPSRSKRSPGGSYVSPVRCKNSPGGSNNTLDGKKIEDQEKRREANEGQEVDANIRYRPNDGPVEYDFSSAKDFYVSNEKWTKYSKRRGIKGKKPFLPPLPKAKPCRLGGWHPSLAPVQELSP